MKLAAIDIGSNAIRLQITKVLEFEKLITFKKLQYVRFPLRLGHDVFTNQEIGKENQEKFLKLMSAFKNLVDLYEVDHCHACATSAMRESSNGRELVKIVRVKLDLNIEIISGEQEAELINQVISLDLDDRTYLHIDVGGGSTELNFYYQKEKVLSKSFNIGSVRRLDHYDEPQVWEEMKDWITDNLADHPHRVTAIGTGGNINKIYELSPRSKNRKISLENIKRTQDYLRNLSLDDRLNKLQLNPDRADVILPASEIYVHGMEAANARQMLVPDVGLKDGINYMLFEKHYPSRGKIFVKNS